MVSMNDKTQAVIRDSRAGAATFSQQSETFVHCNTAHNKPLKDEHRYCTNNCLKLRVLIFQIRLNLPQIQLQVGCALCWFSLNWQLMITAVTYWSYL
jgi:hypothetical protein